MARSGMPNDVAFVGDFAKVVQHFVFVLCAYVHVNGNCVCADADGFLDAANLDFAVYVWAKV